MKLFNIIVTLSVFILFYNCKKENRINKKMEGTWTFTEYTRSGGFIKTDFSQETMKFEFKKYKKAYTRTMQGVYIIDYTDANKIDVRDTFEYQLKGNEIDITNIITKTSKQGKFLKNRFKIEEYKGNELKLRRIDSTEVYIKATK